MTALDGSETAAELGQLVDAVVFDADGLPILFVQGSIGTVALNVPPGGRWQPRPPHWRTLAVAVEESAPAGEGH